MERGVQLKGFHRCCLQRQEESNDVAVRLGEREDPRQCCCDIFLFVSLLSWAMKNRVLPSEGS